MRLRTNSLTAQRGSHSRTFAGWICVALALQACTPIPAALRSETLAATQPAEAAASDMRGGQVRWGGQITAVEHLATETCFDVTSRPLDLWASPLLTDQSLGRFRACAAGFYEPADYAVGRDITVLGTLGGNVTEKIGEQSIQVALVNAQAVHLWPLRPPVVFVPYPAWGIGPSPWGWGWGWGGPWGPWGPW